MRIPKLFALHSRGGFCLYISCVYKVDAETEINILSKEEENENDPNTKLLNDKTNNLQKQGKQYTSIKEYKPTGNLVYNPEMFEKIEKKIT